MMLLPIFWSVWYNIQFDDSSPPKADKAPARRMHRLLAPNRGILEIIYLHAMDSYQGQPLNFEMS